MSTHSLGALIDLSIEVCVGSQNLVKVTPETYLEDLMNEKGITDENTISFVRETFYCVLRYKTLLSRLVDAFFGTPNRLRLLPQFSLSSLLLFNASTAYLIYSL